MDTERAARALVALFSGGDSDDAHVGGLLVAEALRTIRDYERLGPGPWKRQW